MSCHITIAIYGKYDNEAAVNPRMLLTIDYSTISWQAKLYVREWCKVEGRMNWK